jgi:hypothetical protein
MSRALSGRHHFAAEARRFREDDLTPTFAGGELNIRREEESLIGELVIYGSGAPVVWCIESPLRPL